VPDFHGYLFSHGVSFPGGRYFSSRQLPV
jgi:hypothetical protein